MPVTAGFVALGEHTAITVGGQVMRVRTGSLTDRPSAKHDVTNNTSEGFTEKARGPRDCTVTVEMHWRRTDNPAGNPPALDPGDMEGPEVVVYPDATNDPSTYWHLPVTYVESCELTIDGTGVVGYRCQLENQGVFYSPARIS